MALGVVLTLALVGLAVGCIKVQRHRADARKSGSRRRAPRTGPSQRHGHRLSENHMVMPHGVGGRQGPVVLEATVSTLSTESNGMRVDIWVDHRSASKYGVRGSILATLRPWLGDGLLRQGVLIYLHFDGRLEVLTKATTLDDLVEADAIEIVIQTTDPDLPASPREKASSSQPASRQKREPDEEAEPIFNGFHDLS